MNKNLIIVVVILAFVAIVIFLDVPMVQSVLSSKKEIENNQTLLNEKQDFIKIVENLMNKYKSSEEVLKNLDNILPNDSDVPDLLVQIEALANDGGVVLKDVNISTVDDKGVSKAEAVRTGDTTQEKTPSSYKTVTVDLIGTGDYNALRKFLQAIGENMRLIDVDSIVLSGKTQGLGSLFDFEIILKTYYYTN